jgi:DASH complex subunit DAD4
MENPHEERQALLLERIIKNVNLVNDAMMEMNRSLQEVNAYNTKVTVVGELWEGVSVQLPTIRSQVLTLS